MAKKLILIFISILLTQNNLFAQNVTEEYVEKAMELRKKYKDEKIVINYSEEYYTFSREEDKNGKPIVTSNAISNDEYMATVEDAKVIASEGYHEMLDIVKMESKYSIGKKFKKTDLNLNDREYSSESIFDSDSRLKYFLIPMSTTGMRVNVESEKLYKDVRYLTSSYLKSEYPILERKLYYVIPDWLKADLREFNFAVATVEKTTERNEKDKTTTYIFTVKNTEGIEGESNSAKVGLVVPHIVFLAKSFTTKDGVSHKIFEKIDDLYGWYNSLLKNMNNNKEELKDLVTKLTTGKNTDVEKVKSIYYWVQDNIKYIAFERGIAGFQPENAQTVYRNKYGDCKGMANLLATLLQIAGYDARLTWIGTNDIPYDYSLPSVCTDNHMICALKLDGKFYFLDGTESFIAFNDYALRIQGREALIQDGDNFIVQKVPDLGKDRNVYFETKNFSLQKEDLVGKATRKYKGESQTNFLRRVNDVSESNKDKLLLRTLGEGDKNYEVGNISQSTFTDREKPIDITYDLTVKNKVTDVSPEIYVSIDLNKDLEGLLPDAKRKTAIEVEYQSITEYKTELTIPTGLTVKYLPADLNVKTNNYEFTVAYKKQGNTIVLNKKIALNKFIIPMAGMDAFRADIKKLKDMNNEQIILTK